MFYKKSYGFSLIELLTVISIIGILSAIAVPSYLKYKKKPYETWLKLELIEVARLLKITRIQDEGYYKNLWILGYRPKKLLGNVGFPAADANKASNKCTDSTYRGPQVTANFTLTNAYEICNEEFNPVDCKLGDHLPIKNIATCDATKFKIMAITAYGKTLTSDATSSDNPIAFTIDSDGVIDSNVTYP